MNFWVKSYDRYPKPSWCDIPYRSETVGFALPISKEKSDISTSAIRIATAKKFNPPALEKDPGWGESSSVGWDVKAAGDNTPKNHLSDSMHGSFEITKATPEPRAPSPQIKIKDEYIEPTLSPIASIPTIKSEPMDVDIKLEKNDSTPDLPKLFYLVLFNPIGFNRRNPSDLSQVKSWLESDQIFGVDSVQGFWTRCLVSEIVSLKCSAII
jgi:hypothetical protein